MLQSENSQLLAFDQHVGSPLSPISDLNLDPLQGSYSGGHLSPTRTIAFIDASIADAMTLMASAKTDIAVLIDPTKDGIAQVTEVLSNYNNLAGIHFISHGNTAMLQLGSSFLNSGSLSQYASNLQAWAASLSPDADILFHGCNVAAGELGQDFIQQISALTGADIAASTDLTGSSALGGDWDLEYATGDIELGSVFTDLLRSQYQGLLETSLFSPTDTPSIVNATDGTGSAGDYELGMEFRTATAGTISAIRYYKAPSETGDHIGRIWSSTGQLLASVTFTNETASGWQQQALTTPLAIQANTTYIVSVNANTHYVATSNGLATTLTNGDISAVADGSNGVFNVDPSAFPTQSWNSSNYFRDIVFAPTTPVNNTPGTIGVTGATTQNQTLTANVSDVDGLSGVTINYQWQQSSNGTTWTPITGATSQAFTLGQAQVGQQVRATVAYIDALGSSESLTSPATTAVANVNDLGTVAIGGITAQGNTLTATVTDLDGVPGSITYQWQQSSDGTTWTPIAEATNQTLTLNSDLVGQQVRVNAIYTDVLGGSENIVSPATAAITSVVATQSLFTTQLPSNTNATDGVGSAGDYELGMEFRTATAGTISAIRYYKAPSETGDHIGRIWSSTGQLLASVTFTNETASGWQQQALTTPLTIAANTTYVVSVNANTHYVATSNGLATTLTNGDISAVADGSNGVFNVDPSTFPTQSWNNSNYFRDIVFAPTAPVNNTPGTIGVTGVTTQNQTLTADVSDADGLSGVTLTYQWQQSSNGTTWTPITGATSQAFTLGQAQVGQQVRATVAYIDALGSSESLTSTATTAVANVNDLGIVAIGGITAQGNTLTANLTDLDGLPGAIAYQWQQSSDGTTWTPIAEATNQTLTLNSDLVGQQVRVNAIYTDVLGGSENIFSPATAAISATVPTQTFFAPTATPVNPNFTDSGEDWELGMRFTPTTSGSIQAIRYYKAPSETGTHIGRIWSSTGQLLASVTFTNETSSGWQQQTLATPLALQANATYVVSVNANDFYASTTGGFSSSITTGNLSTGVGAGVYNETIGVFPTGTYQNENYFRDIVFAPTAPVNNTPGTIGVTGATTQNQTLTADVSDADGLSGVTLTYQWQQSSNGTTWTPITGATSQAFTLGQAQVGQQVRATVAYIDALGSSESLTSTATTAVANVNDLGIVAIGGITAQGNTLTANLTDLDGLPGAIAYQWQQSSDGTTWTPITGATDPTLSLTSDLVGQQVRVNAIYTDVLGGSENIVSPATAAISETVLTQTFFAPTATPARPNLTDNGDDWELGMRFTPTTSGSIQAIRYYKAPSETGTHIGRIWSSTGQLLASVTFTNETSSGWQQQALATPLAIQADTAYVVSVNANDFYASTTGGFSSSITNGDISTGLGAGVYNETIGVFPTGVYQNENYYRDIVFAATPPNPNNVPGTIGITGNSIQNQTLTANVSDADGLTGVTLNYQWQQSSNGTTWTPITGATGQTLSLGQAQVGQQVRATVSYIDALGTRETVISSATAAVANVNDLGFSILKGSATVGHDLTATIFDADGLPADIAYQWQQFVNSSWIDIIGSTTRTLALTSTLLGLQVRVLASYIDALGSSENVAGSGITIAAQNAIVLENQKTGTTDWRISVSNLALNDEILGYGDATSINKGEAINLKVSLAQAGQYSIDVYRLGYYDGAGGRLVTSVTGLNGVVQSGSTTDPSTRLVEYNWNTSYRLQTDADWTTGLYQVKLTDSRTGKQTYIPFVVRDDNRPADIGFQDAVTTAQAYNNYGGYSTYDANSGGQRALQVSFDRPYAATHLGLTNNNGFSNNTMLTWEYNMTRWLESQGYDVSYYTNLDVHINPFQLYSQNTFLSVGHDEYWSMEMFDSVEQARDNGINLAFFSANTAYWQVRFDPSTSGQANRVMTIYKDSSGIGTNPSIDPIAQTNPAAATTLFRSSQVNRPENSLLGVGYVGDTGNTYGGYDFVVSNASDPYYANTGLSNGDRLTGLVGYEWDSLLNNGLAPAGLVVLSQSPVPSSGLGGLGLLPPGTNDTLSNAVRYTAPSGAKVFSTGSVQWVWGLDSDGVTNPRVDVRAQQIAVNVFADMGAKPQTPNAGIVV